MEIITIETPSLGDRSYIVTDGDVAAVIDPQRDIDRVLDVIEQRGLRITDVFETHIHNDYVTGGLELAQRTDARYHVAADDDVAFDRHPVADGDVVETGALRVRVLHTPGHTPTHLSYVVQGDGDEQAAFTGGSMLFGSVGRTDLIAADRTEELTRAQYRSARRLVEELDDDTKVLPTHGFGSFCSSADTSGEDASTIAQERRDNIALQIEDEDEFVRELVAGLDAYPAYYAHMGPANSAGPAPVDLSPVEVTDPAEVLRRIHVGEWVVDLRSRTAFADDHVTGTINIELGDNASTYLGWLIPWGTPVTLIGSSEQEVAEMQRQLVRIGIDRPAGQRPDGLDAMPDDVDRGEYAVADFATLAERQEAGEDPTVLDVRRNNEWQDGHLPEALHVPLHELLDRMDEVPQGTVWVHCAAGYRASIASSLLARAGRTPVLIDDEFDVSAPRHFDLQQQAA